MVFNVKITKKGKCFGTVRFALKRKISVKTVKRKLLKAVEFALLGKNHGKRTKKYGTLCGRPKRSLAENGTARMRSADKLGAPPVKCVDRNRDFSATLSSKLPNFKI